MSISYGDVVDDERDDGGLDRDAARALEGQGVGLRAAAVDGADLVDDTGGVEQRSVSVVLGVDMRDDPKVHGSHCVSCPRSSWAAVNMSALRIPGLLVVDATRTEASGARRARRARRRTRTA